MYRLATKHTDKTNQRKFSVWTTVDKYWVVNRQAKQWTGAVWQGFRPECNV